MSRQYFPVEATLLDYFAAHALQTVAVQKVQEAFITVGFDESKIVALMVKAAYEIAEAMVQESQKRQEALR